ncbi:MAG TPA: response regulator [Firmicutes bacterium]|nr:response regulator [Bacillota bacterium]
MAKILIVDDSPLFRVLLKEVLVTNGHVTFEAGTVEEALEVFEEVSPDLVFKDLIMEDNDPLALIVKFKSLDPTVKIVVVSTETQKNLIYQAIKAGAKDFLIKPFKTTEVTMTVNRLLGGNIRS